MQPATAQPSIYAVLVGIDGYASPNELRGCVNDIKAVESWLQQTYAATGKLYIQRLTDEDTGQLPNRANIIASFDHFAKAGDNDICLFYFCGHGTNLSDPPPFAGDSGTNAVQALVCIDHGEGFSYVIDKELSYLIWKATYGKPNLDFIAITDCCHSGTSTRSVETTEIILRTLDTLEKSPLIDTYAGYNETINGEKAYETTGSPDDKDNFSIQVKSGPHIHFAAALDSQKAGEIKVNGQSRGAFTYALLNSLQQKRSLSYLQLLETARQKVKNIFTSNMVITHEQTPVVNFNGGYVLARSERIFLSDENTDAKAEYALFYDNQYGWCLQAGILDGISTANNVTVRRNDTSLTLGIKKVNLQFTVLSGADQIDKKEKGLTGIVTGVVNEAVSLGFDETVDKDIQNCFVQQFTQPPGNGTHIYSSTIRLVNEEASYELTSTTNGLLAVKDTNTGAIAIPSFAVPATDEDYKALQSNLNKISRWNYLAHLANNIQALASNQYALNLQLSQSIDGNGNYTFIPGQPSAIAENKIAYIGNSQPAFTLYMENKGAESLYISTAYLAADYSILTTLFTPFQLEPGKGQFLTLKNKSLIKLGNKTGKPITEYLKLFIATKAPIFLGDLEQAGISDRSIGDDEPEKAADADGAWQAVTISFTILPAGQ